MRRGQSPRTKFSEGDNFPKQQLLEVSGLSSKTFDMIRKAARVKGPPHGGLNWLFPREDIEILIRTAAGGRFTERGPPAAAAWRALLDGKLTTDATEDDEED